MRASSSRSMCVLLSLLVAGSLQLAVEASRMIHAQTQAVVEVPQVRAVAQQQQQQQQQQQHTLAPSHRKMLQFNSRWLPQMSGFGVGFRFGGGAAAGAAAVATSALARTRGTSTDHGDDHQQQQVPQFSLTGLPLLGIARVTASTAWTLGGLVQVGADVPVDSELADAFYLTNRLRSQHGVPTLAWSKEYAEEVAKIAGACSGKPSMQEGVEDNIAWGYTTFGAAVQAWYDENRRYSYDAKKVPPGTDHFVRMVWKDAKQMGCAYSLTCRVYICRYSPVQIYKGDLSKQVAPPQVPQTNSG